MGSYAKSMLLKFLSDTVIHISYHIQYIYSLSLSLSKAHLLALCTLARPDFYGPFWVATTAVLFLAELALNGFGTELCCIYSRRHLLEA